jgi:hypothetical protein
MENKLSLSQQITNSADKIIRNWVKENSKDSLLNIAQQINYASVLLRTIGSQAEVEYKKKIWTQK